MGIDKKGYRPKFGALDIFKYIGPGLLVTVGFIDPGNWASNIAAGSQFGYTLLWMVTLSTLMLIVLQHNVAHLGIATGLCLSEAATLYTPKWVSKPVLGSAVLASVATSMAEILGGAVALQMLFGVPLVVGAVLVVIFVLIMLFTGSYKVIEKIIVGFVSIIGLAFLYEVLLVKVDWQAAGLGWITPSIPPGSMVIIMSVLGAVVMPHNLFLHSEVIQSRQWNREEPQVIQRQMKFEFLDTLFSMIVGWAINSAMIILAAATFFQAGIPVEDLPQAQTLLTPLVGPNAAVVFALALLFSALASTITSAMAGGSIFAGIFKEPYDIQDNHSRLGVGLSLLGALGIIILVTWLGVNPLQALILSQMALSIQLPFTIFMQVYLTSSKKVMGDHRNGPWNRVLLLGIGAVVTALNILLLLSMFIKI